MLGEFDYSGALIAQRRLPVAMYFSSFAHNMRMPESPSPAHEYWQRTLRLTGALLKANSLRRPRFLPIGPPTGGERFGWLVRR